MVHGVTIRCFTLPTLLQHGRKAFDTLTVHMQEVRLRCRQQPRHVSVTRHHLIREHRRVWSLPAVVYCFVPVRLDITGRGHFLTHVSGCRRRQVEFTAADASRGRYLFKSCESATFSFLREEEVQPDAVIGITAEVYLD